ncbi:Tripartite motif-containing protein 46 [Liparis tanakae]|uniref:Tripartite motif-containing protein 46 n=1 Tax=Liparis tanakae TaxID=230148 RepID=A0A4Z2ILD1_9TELE|nr:Tripartite motif-containing protein 46 [Liparis tanakae]
MAEAELETFTSIMDALVRISSNMKSMEQELHCPVCDEMVKQPILLPCQHKPNSPASTPNTRSPRQARRPTPRTPDRLERVLRTGAERMWMIYVCVFGTWVNLEGTSFGQI